MNVRLKVPKHQLKTKHFGLIIVYEGCDSVETTTSPPNKIDYNGVTVLIKVGPCS